MSNIFIIYFILFGFISSCSLFDRNSKNESSKPKIKSKNLMGQSCKKVFENVFLDKKIQLVEEIIQSYSKIKDGKFKVNSAKTFLDYCVGTDYIPENGKKMEDYKYDCLVSLDSQPLNKFRKVLDLLKLQSSKNPITKTCSNNNYFNKMKFTFGDQVEVNEKTKVSMNKDCMSFFTRIRPFLILQLLYETNFFQNYFARNDNNFARLKESSFRKRDSGYLALSQAIQFKSFNRNGDVSYLSFHQESDFLLTILWWYFQPIFSKTEIYNYTSEIQHFMKVESEKGSEDPLNGDLEKLYNEIGIKWADGKRDYGITLNQMTKMSDGQFYRCIQNEFNN